MFKEFEEDKKQILFFKQSIDDQLSISFSYLIAQFLQKTKVSNYNKTVHRMINDLEMPKNVLRHKKFKQKALEFFKFVQKFTSYEKRNEKGSKKKFFVNKPQVFNDENFKDDSTRESHVDQKPLQMQLKQGMVVSFNFQKFKSYFTKHQWKIIENNMKKKILVSKNPEENARIKFLRAQNRVTRITYGTDYLNMVMHMELGFWTKTSMLFYFIKKFELKKTEKFLFKTLSTWLITRSVDQEKFLLPILN